MDRRSRSVSGLLYHGGMRKDNFVRIVIWVLVIGMVISTLGVGILSFFSLAVPLTV